MPIMEWDNSLDIGVRAMNDDHKEILDAMNRIFDATKAGRTGDEINRLVERLGQVCVRHFRDEEAYMASIGFPGLTNHSLVHRALLERYAGHAAEIKAAGGRADEAFFHFLRHWLRSHIKGIDRKYGEHAATGRHVA
ncbi:MAG TPA: hemerythrin family protein [Sphingobium sp.]|nr:hemerythrin family protein [Sphingobium sp.]